MAKKKNEAKIKFTADIKEFNDNIQKSNKVLAQSKSELRLNSEVMKTVGECIELLEERQQILQKEFTASQEKTEALSKKLELSKQVFGENSDEVLKLTMQLNNAKSAQQKIQNEINVTNQKIEKQMASEKEEQSMLSKLTTTIDEQESSLQKLKDEYADIILTSGKYSSEAKKTRSEIVKLNAELENNKKKLESVGLATQEVAEKTNNGDGFTIGKGVVADLYADAAKSAITSSATQAIGAELSLDKAQAKIGISEKDMATYRSISYELYEDALGAEFDEVVNTIAVIRQQIGKLTENEMKEATESALTLSDVFDMDVSESTRAVNSLIKQFNISQQEAYNLIIQGAQSGLNQNGDLLDVINEYSVQFKNAGYSADDMFNMLANGVETGTWSVDKLGDAVKEMNIRFSDGTIADALSENRKALGYTKNEVKELQSEFNRGGSNAQKALSNVMNKLSDVNNDTLRYQVGVSMFGTMWEDLGEKTVRSLIDTRGQIKKTNSAMNNVKSIAYDNVAASIESVKRNLEDVGAKMVEEWQPEFNQFAKYVSNNADEIADKIEIVGKVAIVAFTSKKVLNWGKSVYSASKSVVELVSKTKAMIAARIVDTVATTGQTGAQLGLNAAMKASLVGLAASGAIALGVAIYNTTKKTNELSEAAKKAKEETEEFQLALDEANASVEKQFASDEKLLADLDKIFDKNGKVKKGYEDRVSVIQNELKEAYGIELEINNGVAKSLDKVKKKINEVIVAKKAEAIINANQDNYDNAIKKQDEYTKKIIETKDKLEEAQSDYDKKSAEFQRLNKLGYGASESKKLKDEWDVARKAALEAGEEVETLTNDLDAYSTNIQEYNNTVINYEKLQVAIVKGDTEAMSKAIGNMQENLKRAKNSNEETLKKQVEDTHKNYERIKAAYEENTPGITKAAVKQARSVANAAENELENYNKKFRKAGESNVRNYLEGWNSGNISSKIGNSLTQALDNTPGTANYFITQLEKNSIKKNAEGNIVKRPILTTFAEDGWEAAIPINNKPRSQALWFETGRLMGMFNPNANRIEMGNVSIQAAVNMSETNALLRTLVNKDSNTYLNGKKVSEEIASDSDVVNVTRILLAERGCAYE